jgi:hypothetical protein
MMKKVSFRMDGFSEHFFHHGVTDSKAQELLDAVGTDKVVRYTFTFNNKSKEAAVYMGNVIMVTVGP